MISHRFLSGHRTIGPVTIYGRNAMHWGVNIRSKKYGYICFRLPLPCYGRWWPLYFYVSPNATPWAATYLRSRGYKTDKILAPIRRYRFGHNFSIDQHRDALYEINEMI